jgi:hypothetical protein
VRGKSADDDGLAVRSLFGDVVNTDVAAGTRLVFNDDVAKVCAGFFSYGAGRDVKRTSGRIRHDDADGVVGCANLSEGRNCTKAKRSDDRTHDAAAQFV